MRCPQASFEAQPRIARLLAPKMGIGPYNWRAANFAARRNAIISRIIPFCTEYVTNTATPRMLTSADARPNTHDAQ